MGCISGGYEGFVLQSCLFDIFCKMLCNSVLSVFGGVSASFGQCVKTRL
jgi:hypothetical protein